MATGDNGRRRSEDRGHPLMAARRRANYTAAEQAFSLALQERLQALLEGKRDHLEVLRRYPQEPGRLGVMALPPGVVAADLRAAVVETLLADAIGFVCADAAGGPIAQQVGADGSLFELQTFTTKFPHIVIQRTDRYRAGELEPIETTWCLQRVQNQRRQTQVNRMLDAINLAFEVVRLVR